MVKRLENKITYILKKKDDLHDVQKQNKKCNWLLKKITK